MARSLRSIIKQFFQTGDVPTESQYVDTIDSSVYWEDDVEHTLTNDADKVPASDAVYAAIGAVPVPNLNEVLAEGNETLGINIKLQNSDSIELDNTSVLRKGTYDFGGLGGISRICSVGYEDMWQSGIHHVFDNNGFLRESTNCFNYVPNASYDSSLRFQIGSRWVLDDGTLYVCADATVGYAVWDLISNVPNLQEVTDVYNVTTNNITAADIYSQNAAGTTQIAILTNGEIAHTPDTTTPTNKTTLDFGFPTATNTITLQDASGTVAFLSDITGGGVASVTGNIVDNTDPANPDASLTAANVHTFVDSLTALVTPADADKMIIVDNSTSLAKKISWANIKATLTTYFDGLYTAKNTTITGATKTKVTYDSKGLITSGADATTADIAASTNKNYVTDAQAVVIGNTSGTNTGDQTLAGLGGVAANAAITGATKTKITYDSKGLVTSGADATTADIASSTDKRYVTDAQLTVIGNTSGTNSGNETTTTIGTLINGATSKTTPVDADQVGLMDSAASNILKKLSWANIKATLKTYFDTLYIPTSSNLYITTGDQSTSGTTNVGITGLSITTVANKRYAFEGYFRVGCSSTGGVKFTVTAPSGSTLNVGFMGPATPNSTNGIQQFINASGTQTAALANAISSIGIIKIYGEVSTGATTGTIQVGFASAVTTQTSTIYQNGTNIVYTER